jgi:hypothetical protein
METPEVTPAGPRRNPDRPGSQGGRWGFGRGFAKFPARPLSPPPPPAPPSPPLGPLGYTVCPLKVRVDPPPILFKVTPFDSEYIEIPNIRRQIRIPIGSCGDSSIR